MVVADAYDYLYVTLNEVIAIYQRLIVAKGVR